MKKMMLGLVACSLLGLNGITLATSTATTDTDANNVQRYELENDAGQPGSAATAANQQDEGTAKTETAQQDSPAIAGQPTQGVY